MKSEFTQMAKSWLLGCTMVLTGAAAFAHSEGRCEVRHPDPAALAEALSATKEPLQALALGASRPVAVVDVLVAFDKSGADYAIRSGGSIEAFAESCMARMNGALPNTGLDAFLKFRLAGIAAIEERASGLDAALDSLIDSRGFVVARGEWRKITDARERCGADIVSVLVDTGDGKSGQVGTGYALDHASEAHGFGAWAYNACSIRSVEEDFTMLHEIGHNMGCGHPDASCASPLAMSLGPQSTDYASGYYTWSGGRGYYTVMGYNFGGLQANGTYSPTCIFDPLPCFSSPDYTYNGLTVGTDRNDNTRVLRETCQAVSQFRKAVTPEEKIEVGCPALEQSVLMVGVGEGGVDYPIECNVELKKLSAKGLPSGMKLVQDKKTKAYVIQGAPKKAGAATVKLSAVSASGAKAECSFVLKVLALPDGLVGTFNGFVLKADDGARTGTLSLTAKADGKITAKVVTANQTFSFSAKGWGAVSDEDCGLVARVEMETQKGDVLVLDVNASAPWTDWAMDGEFQTAQDELHDVAAFRNAYAKNGKIPADPDAAKFLADVLSHNKGKYGFEAEEADGEWTLTPSDAKKPAVTVTVDKKGMAKLKGKLGKTSVSGTAQVTYGGNDTTAFVRFLVPAKVDGVKRMVHVPAELNFR